MLPALQMKERGLEEVVQDRTSGIRVCVIPLASNITLNTIEKQVIPVGFHNFSKSFRPNMATIRVLSLGTKCGQM